MIEEFGIDEEAETETETYNTISYREYAGQIDEDSLIVITK